MDILEGLNPAQRAAVEAIEGPVLIIAGPGSGKTRVITHRIAYLIKTVGVSPRRIMAVTFTNKAAREMASRLEKLAGGSLQYLSIGTFHAICARILRTDGKAIGVEPGFVIYDDDDQTSLIKRALQETGLDPKQYPPRGIASAIGAAKSSVLTPAEFAERGRSYFDEVAGRVYERYQALLQQSGALDFDDLLMKTVQLFDKHPDVLARYQERYLHIQVDEFQDTNLVQYSLLKQLAAKHRNICVVGDPDQSIYSWRYADIRNILSFEKDYPDARVVLLEQNYRSTRLILDTASAIISSNRQRKEKRLWTTNEPGEQIKVAEAYTEQEEAQFVVGEIEKLVGQGSFKHGDFAVMYRTNAQSRVLEEAFIRYGVPYKLVAGTRFYERKEVKDIIAYLRLIQNPDDSVSLMRIVNVPGRGIGQQTLGQLSGWAKSLGVSEYRALQHLAHSPDIEHPFSPRAAKTLAAFCEMIESFIARSRELNLAELFDRVVEESGYRDFLMSDPDGEERWENVLELRTVAQQYAALQPREGLSALLEGVALVADVDELGENPSVVTLITLHQAKGLEFPVVFIVGMEEGLLPHNRSMDDPAQMEEERRLCYVGVTRARKLVYLVRAFRRSLMGSSAVNKPSRFLYDIPANFICGGDLWKGDGGGSTSEALYSWEKPAQARPQLPDEEYRPGERVRHAVFGEGTVVSSRKSGEDIEVVVAFPGAGVKKLSLSFARLEKLG